MTPSEGFIVSPSEVGVDILWSMRCLLGRIPGVLACVNRWCVRGDSLIWYGAVGIVDVCWVSVRVGAMFSAVVPKIVTSCCNALPCHPWKVWFYYIIFWITQIRVVAIHVASSTGISVGMVQYCE